MINTESFVFYESVFKQGQRLEKMLGPEKALKFYNAIMEFGLYGVMPDEDDEVWLYGFEQSITSITSAKDRYLQSIENGKKGGRKPTIPKEKVIELKGQGLTNEAIAKQIGCSTSSVEKILKEWRDTVKTGKTHNNLNDNVNDNDNDNVNDNDKYIESLGFQPNLSGGASPTQTKQFRF